MFKMTRLVCILLIPFCFLFITNSCSNPTQEVDVKSIDIDSFRVALEKHDFTSKYAPFLQVDLIKLYEAGKLGDAAGNNAYAPYRGMFGSIPDSIPLTNVNQIINAQDKIDTWLYNSPGLIQGWQINPDEAILIIAKTPPKCKYFSYCGFIFNKYYEKEQKQKWVWTSFNDTINNMTIKTTGTPNGIQGDSFDKDTAIIITANKEVDQRLRKILNENGYPDSIINTYIIPSSMVKMGIGPEYDTIVFGQRMTLFDDEEAGEKYVKAITAALKITSTIPVEADYFPSPLLRVRGNGKTEIDYIPALNELRKAILEKYSGLEANELTTSVWLTESYDAVQTEVYVAGESRDTVYLRSEEFTLGDDPNEMVVVYGVNHVASGKATYTNCNFYGKAAWNGVAGIYNYQYEGSAEEYLPDNPLAKDLYVCIFLRSGSSEKNLISVPVGPKAHGVRLDEPAFIGFRAYLEPSTKVGPLNTELIYDRVIKFNPKK